MQTTTSELEPQTWRRSELDTRARLMRAAPASAGASASAAAAAAAVYMSSPGTVSSCKSTSSASRFSLAGHVTPTQQQQQPRSTRTLLSRLFRSSKSKSSDSPRCDSDIGDDEEEQQQQHGNARERRRHASDAHSPILASSMYALHLREQRPHHESLGDQLLDSSFYYSQQQQQLNEADDMRRRESEPAHTKQSYSYYQQQLQQASKQHRSGLYPVAAERFPTRKILIQGYLTKLSTHKYWHAKSSYFVLEECIVAPAAMLQVTLRQFRKQEDARMAQAEPLVLSEIVLSEDDVVVDISNRHAKHGFELLFSGFDTPQQHVEPATTTGSSIWSTVAALTSSSASAHNHNRESSFVSSSATVVHSLRLAAPDALALESWIAVLGSAIAKLIFQATRSQQQQQLLHYPSGHTTATTATTTTTNKAIATAKVAPIVSDHPDDDDDDFLKEEIRQAEQQQHQQQNGQNDGDDNDEEKEEEKSRHPNGYHTVSQLESEQQRDCDSIDIEQGLLQQKPLRRCPSCYQWMPYDCDDGEQTSCCSCEGSEEEEYSGSDNNNNFHHSHGRRHDGNSNSNNNNQEDNQSDEFASSSSATSFTPSDSPDDPFERAATFDQDLSSNSNSSDLSRHHAFSNFIVSPNPPVQITGSSSLSSSVSSYSPTVAPYPAKMVQSEQYGDDLESELKASSLSSSAAALARASSGATAFLRSQFARANHSLSSSSAAQCQRPPMHSFTASGQVFTLDTRYKLVKPIGTGAYGAVIAVSDAVADCSVAVKKITNIFEDLVDAKRILREVRLLHHFHHKNITKLLDLSPPISKKQFEDMYIITELMETDLHQVIYSMQPMSDDHVKYFLYQMLCALHHIHSAGVIHRDMKPSNVLLNSNCDLKICDFGLARGGVPTPSHHQGQPNQTTSRKNREELTEYVVTRWYRAPEIMLNCLQYTEAIDVWAVGCIFAEMLLREPLFPGNDYIHQLKLIIKFLGTPKQEDIEFVKNVKALRFLTKLPISKPKKWRDVFATSEDVNPQAVDLLSRMLIFNPEKRISVDQALQHPYLATFYDPADVTNAPEFDFKFDLPDDKLSKEALIDLLCEDIEQFHPTVPPTVSSTSSTTNASSRFFGMGMTASAS